MNCDLKFIGIGSTFNEHEINNSALLEDNEQVLLIDCGGTVFTEIKRRGLIDGTKEPFVILTHTHCDHIGSLANLILYCRYHLNKVIKIVLPCKAEHGAEYRKTLCDFLAIQGCSIGEYDFVYENKFAMFNSRLHVHLETVQHDARIKSFGINVLLDDKKVFFYTGDTNDYWLASRKNNEGFQKIYSDCSNDSTKKSFHPNLDDMATTIPRSERHKIYCMHMENNEAIRKALSLGFNIAKVDED